MVDLAARWCARKRTSLYLGLSATLVLFVPAGAQEHWSIDVAGVLARHLTHSGGPPLGAAGAEIQVFRVTGSDWAWGGSLGHHRLGRFPNPVPGDYRDESATAAGVRLRRGGGGRRSSFGYGKAGLDVYAVTDRPATGGAGRDPGVGGYVGVGRMMRGTGSRIGALAELGIHGVLATGELTGGGGWYLTLMLGLSF
jgi:hypothetical protein